MTTPTWSTALRLIFFAGSTLAALPASADTQTGPEAAVTSSNPPTAVADNTTSDAEAADFETAKKTGTEWAVLNFIRAYPNSKLLTAARLELCDIIYARPRAHSVTLSMHSLEVASLLSERCSFRSEVSSELLAAYRQASVKGGSVQHFDRLSRAEDSELILALANTIITRAMSGYSINSGPSIIPVIVDKRHPILIEISDFDLERSLQSKEALFEDTETRGIYIFGIIADQGSDITTTMYDRAEHSLSERNLSFQPSTSTNSYVAANKPALRIASGRGRISGTFIVNGRRIVFERATLRFDAQFTS